MKPQICVLGTIKNSVKTTKSGNWEYWQKLHPEPVELLYLRVLLFVAAEDHNSK